MKFPLRYTHIDPSASRPHCMAMEYIAQKPPLGYHSVRRAVGDEGVALSCSIKIKPERGPMTPRRLRVILYILGHFSSP